MLGEVLMRILVLAALVFACFAITPETRAQGERSATACIASGPDRADCFVSGATAQVFRISRDRSTWSGFAGLGRSPIGLGAPSCLSRASGGQFDCFAMASDGSLFSRTAVTGWTSMAGSGTPSSRASCVSIAVDQIDCFIRDRMNTLSRRTYHRGRWFEWERLPGLIMSDLPHCVVVDDGSLPTVTIATPIWCFARGPRNELWMATVPRLPSPTAPARWTNLGGDVRSYPSCVAADYGEVLCFVRGTDNALWWKKVDPYGGGTWRSAGGVLTSDPSCVSYTSARIDCFVRGTDNAMWRMAGSRYAAADHGFGFSGFSSMGGVLTSAPTCTVYRPALNITGAAHERIDCYTRGTDEALYNIVWFPSGGTGWQSLGGRIGFWAREAG